jgi:hypothetical protein
MLSPIRESDGGPRRGSSRRGWIAATVGVIAGMLLVVLTPAPSITGSLSGEQVGSAYCPPGDYCPILMAPKTIWLPSVDAIGLNWTSQNGTTVRVDLLRVSGDSVVVACDWPTSGAGACSFSSLSEPSPAPFELEVGATQWSATKLPAVNYTFVW